MTRKELYKLITDEIIKELDDVVSIHFIKQLKGKNFSYKFSVKKEYGNEYYIKFDGDNVYQLVSENYIKDVITLHEINKTSRIKKYERTQNHELRIIYR